MALTLPVHAAARGMLNIVAQDLGRRLIRSDDDFLVAPAVSGAMSPDDLRVLVDGLDAARLSFERVETALRLLVDAETGPR